MLRAERLFKDVRWGGCFVYTLDQLASLHIYSSSGFLPGFLWQVRIKAKVADFQKVAEFTHSPRNLRRRFLRRGVARGAEPPLHRKFLDFGCRI